MPKSTSYKVAPSTTEIIARVLSVPPKARVRADSKAIMLNANAYRLLSNDGKEEVDLVAIIEEGGKVIIRPLEIEGLVGVCRVSERRSISCGSMKDIRPGKDMNAAWDDFKGELALTYEESDGT